MDADVFITLSHFKGHEATGFGGALKNIGMAADPAPARWKCTTQASPMWSRKTASAAAAVSKSAPMMLPPLQTARPPLTTTNVLAAAAASESAPWMPSALPEMKAMISSTVK